MRLATVVGPGEVGMVCSCEDLDMQLANCVDQKGCSSAAKT